MICEQLYGFMPTKNSTETMLDMRRLMMKYREGQRELHCVFVDLKKVCEGAERGSVVLYEEF